ncbi:baseplate J/gp47 family protein [Pantoea piersonii]|jgi:uncharacterized phage protein gp47/JayE|uniref:baseplate J/gp47 family protein n=1 Tax=Pantoea piersonii TaxID=2364647 RepID=UPI000EA28695|nr:baseplate J/gp47 family protein [Pantoea piersonii]MBZ6386809.1 baseplate J/gp47 family protein [Pantoea piersonii]MBZ6400042.1 baseplate J/gp47 family protein [Pantoea piersonii]MBZ6409096.1 baseplate J/gp47 family protein [Pantoea piersonii]MBZ6426093.1 baseplate J/gp47 family protein [Pantoea piersonii]NYB04682.1 baseplate J/gp47 family protein [Pantoea piersonii]
MASLNIKSFTELVREQVTTLQARAAKLTDLSTGSILRALVESNAGVAMWIQQLIVKLLVTTRAATCSGEDLDSWMADFGFRRLSAVQATGIVTFSRFTAAEPAFIRTGTRITTTDGSQAYAVVEDLTSAAWDASQGGYTIARGVVSLTVPVRADTAGAAGNAQAGTVTVIVGSIPYVDFVMNNAPFTGGKDAEQDDAFRARFVLWIASLSKSTRAAAGYALSSIQAGVTYTLTENTTYEGLAKPGYFYAVVDDGSGEPSDSFIEQACTAVEAVRGFTVSFGVFRPVKRLANVTLTVITDASADHAAVVRLVQAAIRTYINSLSLGQLLAYTQLVKVAYNASPLITNVTSLALNNGNADLAASEKEVIRPGTVTVS